ncbi:MAG: CDP-alcohol phosphatidyltransferase family protein [Bdellovibrionota bacterium]
MNDLNRRPVKSRNVGAFHRIAAALVKLGLTPNQISVMSAVFAAGGAASLLYAPYAEAWLPRLGLLVGALLGIQLRLTCNLLDGLMAVEGGKKTPAGEFFNDFPDRLSDVFLILAAGYAASSVPLAFTAALLAVLTAYIRVLGNSMGAPPLFLGPMAKQHRMAVLNVAILGVAVTGSFPLCLNIALYVIAAGSFVTCVRRAAAIFRHFGNPQS